MADISEIVEHLRKAEALMKEASLELENSTLSNVECPNCKSLNMRLNFNNSDCNLLPYRYSKYKIRHNWICEYCGSERDKLLEEMTVEEAAEEAITNAFIDGKDWDASYLSVEEKV